MTENVSEKNNFGTTVISTLAFPTAIGTVQSIGFAKEAKKMNKTIKKFAEENADVFKNFSRKTLKNDVFTNSIDVSKTYDEYRSLRKNVSKLTKKVKKGKATQEALDNATDLLNDAKTAIKDGKKFEIVEETIKGTDKTKKIAKACDIAESGTSALKGFGKSSLNNFKNELKFKTGWFNYIMTAVQFIPNVVQKVIPAFKEKGFKEGMIATGKVLVQAGTDLVSYAAGGAIGRTIGAAVGSIFGPVGTWVGATLGDTICSIVVGSNATKVVNKALGEDEQQTAEANEQAANTDTQTIDEATQIAQEPYNNDKSYYWNTGLQKNIVIDNNSYTGNKNLDEKLKKLNVIS